ncbi:MAG0490 family ComEA-like DNA-binding protein [Mycoplasmopsis columboralis]|uniref:Helix-hairpin-helix domain-containing protein n=1 Tax=Mycoplasmopsis columboralis TaxID=171282 RepID=A0A449B7J7_9BACT|nr:hypothetical protein [Mycoplasmopsis columboralis]VEU76571.1 Uncharacterised protein [Mycoplasmopsis columboralis]
MKWPKLIKQMFWIPLVVIPLVIVYFYKQENTNESFKPKSESFTYSVSGAITFEGVHISKNPLTYRQLFFAVKLLPNSDISGFDLNTLAPLKSDIFVPYKNLSLKWNDLTSEKQLRHLNLPKRVIKTILEYKNKKQGVPTWEDIAQISGIGKSTLKKLQTFLLLE